MRCEEHIYFFWTYPSSYKDATQRRWSELKTYFSTDPIVQSFSARWAISVFLKPHLWKIRNLLLQWRKHCVIGTLNDYMHRERFGYQYKSFGRKIKAKKAEFIFRPAFPVMEMALPAADWGFEKYTGILTAYKEVCSLQVRSSTTEAKYSLKG